MMCALCTTVKLPKFLTVPQGVQVGHWFISLSCACYDSFILLLKLFKEVQVGARTWHLDTWCIFMVCTDLSLLKGWQYTYIQMVSQTNFKEVLCASSWMWLLTPNLWLNSNTEVFKWLFTCSFSSRFNFATQHFIMLRWTGDGHRLQISPTNRGCRSQCTQDVSLLPWLHNTYLGCTFMTK